MRRNLTYALSESLRFVPLFTNRPDIARTKLRKALSASGNPIGFTDTMKNAGGVAVEKPQGEMAGPPQLFKSYGRGGAERYPSPSPAYAKLSLREDEQELARLFGVKKIRFGESLQITENGLILPAAGAIEAIIFAKHFRKGMKKAAPLVKQMLAGNETRIKMPALNEADLALAVWFIGLSGRGAGVVFSDNYLDSGKISGALGEKGFDLGKLQDEFYAVQLEMMNVLKFGPDGKRVRMDD